MSKGKTLTPPVKLERTGPCTVRGVHRGTRLKWRCRCQGWARWSRVDQWEQCLCGHTQAVHEPRQP